MKTTLFSSLFVITSLFLSAQSATDFDFWIGEWEVKDTANVVLGHSTITKAKEGQIHESWRSVKSSFTGVSVNFFNPNENHWHQHWVDFQGSKLDLKGNLENGKMVLYSELKQNKDGEKYYDRITWTPNPNGNVTQRWDILNENKEFVKTSFLGIYNRK